MIERLPEKTRNIAKAMFVGAGIGGKAGEMPTTVGSGAPAKTFFASGGRGPFAMATPRPRLKPVTRQQGARFSPGFAFWPPVVDHKFGGLAGAGELRLRIFMNSYARKGARWRSDMGFKAASNRQTSGNDAAKSAFGSDHLDHNIDVAT